MSTINHEVVITQRDDESTVIYLDGHELAGVVAYKIERGLEPLQRVTFTVLAYEVRVP